MRELVAAIMYSAIYAIGEIAEKMLRAPIFLESHRVFWPIDFRSNQGKSDYEKD